MKYQLILIGIGPHELILPIADDELSFKDTLVEKIKDLLIEELKLSLTRNSITFQFEGEKLVDTKSLEEYDINNMDEIR